MDISIATLGSLLRRAVNWVPRALGKIGVFVTYGKPDPIPVQIMVEESGKVQPLVVDLNRLLFSDYGIVYMLRRYRKRRTPEYWSAIRRRGAECQNDLHNLYGALETLRGSKLLADYPDIDRDVRNMIEAKEQTFYFELNNCPEQPHLNDLPKIDHLIALGEDLKVKALAAVEMSQKDMKAFLAQHRDRIDALRQQFADPKARGKAH
jgi:hypothetical protein